MREGWTYKKLGEVCDIICGQDYKKVESPDGKYPIYGTGGIMGFANQFRCPAYSVIIGRKGSINNPLYVEEDFWNVDTAFGIVPSKANLISKYFFYFCKSYDFTKHNVAVTIPSLRRIDLLKIPIPVPPLVEQERIVAELDLLQGIIEKKKKQLKAYDQLAQSIFYTMFGDPVTNEKGWEVKNMEDVGELQRGSGLSKKDLTEDGFPCILYGQIHTRFGAFTRKHIACIPQELVSTAKIAHFGDIVMAITSEDVEGSCKSVAWMGDYDIAVGSDAAIYRHTLNPIYVSYYTQTKAFYFEKAKYAKGFKVTHISTKEIAKIPIPVPPLSLQEEFAEKVEAIERQKALVQQSIEETQTMFDYTMDKYFG